MKLLRTKNGTYNLDGVVAVKPDDTGILLVFNNKDMHLKISDIDARKAVCNAIFRVLRDNKNLVYDHGKWLLETRIGKDNYRACCIWEER